MVATLGTFAERTPDATAIIAGTASALLIHAFGERNAGPFTVIDSADAKLTRPFASASALADEHRLVRIWGGIHFTFETLASFGSCTRLGAYAADNVLRLR